MSATTQLLGANVRTHGRRYLATGLAVAISIAFVSACLTLMTGLGNAITGAVRMDYGGAATIVRLDPGETDLEAPSLSRLIPTIEKVDGVGSVAEVSSARAEAQAGTERADVLVRTWRSAPFSSPHLDEGVAPSSLTDVVMPQTLADALGVKVGDSLSVPDHRRGNPEERVDLTVTGILHSQLFSLSSFFVTPEAMSSIFAASPHMLLVSAKDMDSPDEATQQRVTDAVQAALSNAGLPAKVETHHVVLDRELAEMNATVAASTVMISAFPAIAVFVALIVVSTTFQVILQQRRRELALLRTLGARRRQVRRLVLAEAFIVGAIASALGTVAGTLVATFGVWKFELTTTWAEALHQCDPMLICSTWALGALLTVIIGLRPALGIARIAPIAALSPMDETGARARKSHWMRTILAALLIIGGLVMILVGTRMEQGENRFLLMFGASLVVLLGSILMCTLVVPLLTRLVGRIVPGVVASMARENTVRNPSRTAATGTAIVIGVTLMTTMLVGASSLQATLEGEVNTKRPFDLVAVADPGVLTPELQERISSTEGVAATVAQKQAVVEMSLPDGSSLPEGTPNPLALIGQPDLSPVAHADVIEPVPADTVLINADRLPTVVPEARLCLEGTQKCRVFKVEQNGRVEYGSLVTNAATLDAFAPKAEVQSVVIRLEDGADATKVQTALTSLSSQLSVTGAALERQMYFQVIDVVLLVLLALLGVSVVVALVGVANTLGLSVAERTRENGLLRALGLTKRQMKRMLLVESLLISLTGAFIGLGLGVGLAWVGMLALPLEVDSLLLVVPWARVAGIIAVAIISAALAAWMPGRRAARTSPVEALAHE